MTAAIGTQRFYRLQDGADHAFHLLWGRDNQLHRRRHLHFYVKSHTVIYTLQPTFGGWSDCTDTIRKQCAELVSRAVSKTAAYGIGAVHWTFTDREAHVHVHKDEYHLVMWGDKAAPQTLPQA